MLTIFFFIFFFVRVEELTVIFDCPDQILVCSDRLDNFYVCFDHLSKFRYVLKFSTKKIVLDFARSTPDIYLSIVSAQKNELDPIRYVLTVTTNCFDHKLSKIVESN